MGMMFVVPFLFVMAARHVQLSDDAEVEDLLASVEPVLPANGDFAAAATSLATDFGAKDVVDAVGAEPHKKSLPPPNFFETRVAMAPTSIAPLTDADARQTAKPRGELSDSMLAMTTFDEPRTLGATESVPSPINVSVSDVPTVVDPEDVVDKEPASDVTEPTMPTTHQGDADGVPSYFEATSHLAIRSAMQSPTEGNPPSGSADKRGSKTKKSVNALDQEMRLAMSGRVPIVSGNSDVIPTDADPFASSAKHTIVDVVLQQPLEIRKVKRVENVVAQTNTPGWPIALVKSDLPDDHWWVQQMVGIRGNSFAARVNFGNENSIPGSVYHMVFVFLDSADEVRRFRIAKRFKELPDGTRRSRKFTFTRR